MKIRSFLVYDNSSDANFRSWGSTISANLASLGFVQTGDTGQVNWSTVTAPAGGSYVYEIWRGAGANQTNCPVFFKIEYGTSSGVIPGFAIKFGTGSNGSGTLTGNLTTRKVASFGASAQGASIYECNFYGDGSGNALGIMMWRDAPDGAQFLLMMERSLSNVGAYTDLYFSYVFGYYSTNWVQQSVFATGGTGASYGTITTENASTSPSIVQTNTSVSTESYGGNIPTLPIFPIVGWVGNPFTVLSSMKTGDATEGTTFTDTVYGATHTYLMSKRTYPFTYCGSTSGSYAVAMRWE